MSNRQLTTATILLVSCYLTQSAIGKPLYQEVSTTLPFFGSSTAKARTTETYELIEWNIASYKSLMRGVSEGFYSSP